MDIHRGLAESEGTPNQPSLQPDDDSQDEFERDHCDVQTVSPTELEEPTSCELECKASVAAWEKVRHSMLHIVTESGAMQSGQKCLLCEKHAVLTCVNCGPVAFYCEGCFSDLHKYVNTSCSREVGG